VGLWAPLSNPCPWWTKVELWFENCLQISRGERQGGSHWFDGRDFGIGLQELINSSNFQSGDAQGAMVLKPCGVSQLFLLCHWQDIYVLNIWGERPTFCVSQVYGASLLSWRPSKTWLIVLQSNPRLFRDFGKLPSVWDDGSHVVGSSCGNVREMQHVGEWTP